MKYLEVKAFLAIVRLGNLTRASKSLFISQSTLSQRLNSLEDKLKVKLILRNRGRDYIKLTSTGEKFLKVALKMEELITEAKDLRTIQGEDPIVIGAVDSVHNYVLNFLYPKVREQYRKTRLILRTHQSDEIYSLLERQEIDIGFPLQERIIQDFNVNKYFQEKLVLIKKKETNPWGKINNSDLNPEYELYINWGADFRTWHEKWWGTKGTRGSQVDTGSLLLRFMNHPENWAIVPLSMAKRFQESEDIDIRSLLEEPPMRTCYIAFNKNFDRKDIIKNCFMKNTNLIKQIVES